MKSKDEQIMGRLRTQTITPTGYSESYTFREIGRDYVTASPTVRRPKPLDLFSNGTSLSRYRRLESHSTGISRSVASNLITLTEVRVFEKAITMPSTSFTGLDPGIGPLNNRLLERIKESNANLLVDMVEFRKTSSMIAVAARDIVKTFHRFRSGRFIGDFVRILQKPRDRGERLLASRWLEYQYGWLPTMSSIHSYGEVIANRIRDGISREIRLTDKYGTTRSTTFVGGSSTAVLTGRRKAICRYVVKNSSLKTMSELGISNPLLVAWELVPFSFVADWFFDVGNYINRIDALTGVSNLRVIHVKHERSVKTVDYFGYGEMVRPARYIETITSYDRTGPQTTIFNSYSGFSLPTANLRNKLLSGLSLLSVLRASTRNFK